MREIKLDKRALRRPFDCFDLDEAKKYIGKLCYFADYTSDFEDLGSCYQGILTSCDGDPDNPFLTESRVGFEHCLPCDLTLTEEYKVSIPLTMDEFLCKFPIGKVITLRKLDRNGDSVEPEILAMVTGVQKETDTVFIGPKALTLRELYYYDGGDDSDENPFRSAIKVCAKSKDEALKMALPSEGLDVEYIPKSMRG